MTDLITGNYILKAHLIDGGVPTQLKHSTYDLRIGQIFPSNGKEIKDGIYFLEPRETVLVLSEEEFSLPGTITGLATLRTTLTRRGLLALNVGIIDPFFNGPISTTLINFSENTIPIKLGMPFFRVLFLKHSDTEEFHKESENRKREDYVEELYVAAHCDFPRNFLNIPKLDNNFFAETAFKMLKGATIKFWYVMIPFWLFVISVITFLFMETGYWAFFKKFLIVAKDHIPFF